MRIEIYKIDETFKETGTPRLAIFTFKPCPCGCTKNNGFGLNLWFFGINFQF